MIIAERPEMRGADVRAARDSDASVKASSKVAIYNVALPATTIEQHYNAGKNP